MGRGPFLLAPVLLARERSLEQHLLGETAQFIGQIRLPERLLGLGHRLRRPARQAQRVGQLGSHLGGLRGRRVPAQRGTGQGHRLGQPPGGRQGVDGGHRTVETGGSPGRGEFEGPYGQVGGGLRGRRKHLAYGPVEAGQGVGVLRPGAAHQVGGGRDRRPAASQQHLPGLPVQCLAYRRGEALGHGAPQQVVPERQQAGVRHHDPGLLRLLQRRQQLAGRPAEHLREVVRVEGTAQDGRDLQQLAGTRGQPAQAPSYDLLHPSRQPPRDQPRLTGGDLHRALVVESAEELDEQERVASRPGRELQQLRAGRRAEGVGDHLAYGLVAQRLQRDPGGAVAFEDLVQPVRPRAAAAARTGQDPHQGVGGQLGDQRAQRQQGRRVGPLQIVQGDQVRASCGPLLQPGLQPLHAVAVAGRPGSPAAAGTPERRHERLQRRELTRLIGRTPGEGESASRRDVDGLVEQPALAHARLALDQQYPATAPLGRPQQSGQNPRLAVPAAPRRTLSGRVRAERRNSPRTCLRHDSISLL